MSTAAKHHNAGFLALVNDAKSRVKEIDIEQYKEKAVSGEPFLTVDVREDNEWAAGHAAGALHLGRASLSGTSRPKSRTKIRQWSCIAAEDTGPPWLPMRCRRWD